MSKNNPKRQALNELVRTVGRGIAFAQGCNCGEATKSSWDFLYSYFALCTRKDVKAEADALKIPSALDYVESIGELERLCRLAFCLYGTEDFTTLIGKGALADLKERMGVV
jgi:hypothetical protein